MNRKLIAAVGLGVVLLGVYFVVQLYADNAAEKELNAAIENAEGLADIAYDDVHVDLISRDVRISDIRIVQKGGAQSENVRINEVIIRDMDTESEDMPAFMNFECSGIVLDIKELGKDARGFREMGYTETLLLNLIVDYRYDKEKKMLDIRKLGIGADNMGELELHLRLGNILLDPDQLIALLFTYPQITIHEAGIGYQDDSLAERMMQVSARERNMEMKEYQAELLREVDQEIEQETDPFTRNALNEIREFIRDPDSFTISVSPPNPQPLGSLLQVPEPRDIIKLLNVQVES